MRVFPGLLILCRVYVIAALVIAGVSAPVVYAVIPWSMLLAYLYLEFRPSPVKDQAHLRLPCILFLTLSLPVFFEPLLGVWFSPLLALPVLPLLDHSLRQFASNYKSGSPPAFATGSSVREGRRPTELCLWLSLSLFTIGLVALALAGWSLLLSVALVSVYLTGLIVLVWRRANPQSLVPSHQSPAPVSAEVISRRVVAGNFIQAPVRLVNRSMLAGHLRLFSPYPWFSVMPSRLVLDKPVIEIEVSLKAPLAGPAPVALAAVFIDPWGLIKNDFTMKILDLFVIPRAKYAEWLARKYLETSRGGSQGVMTAVATSTRRASRRGIEFYGLRAYQPGDSARTIDWKHTSKLHEIIVKEFLDTGAESAVVAVNLSVTGEEEKDKVVSDLITTALTLARENIPSALAAYNHREVVRTTRLLDPRQALIGALSLVREITISLNPRRYLAVPDVGRLKANLSRLRQSRHASANKLAELLQLEYTALLETARQNPATAALNNVLAGVKGKVNVLIVSGRNHDAEALAFNEHALKSRGYRFLL